MTTIAAMYDLPSFNTLVQVNKKMLTCLEICQQLSVVYYQKKSDLANKSFKNLIHEFLQTDA